MIQFTVYRFRTQLLPYVLIGVIALLLAGCSSSPDIFSSPRIIFQPEEPYSVPQATPSTTEQTPPASPDLSTVTPSVPTSAETTEESPRTSWLMTAVRLDAAQSVVQSAPKFGVRSIQLGGDIITAIDDLILNPQKRDYIRGLASSMDQMGIETYVWSRELHLEGKTFRFHWNTPLVSARQAAYRYAFQENPELDGVVLCFSDALLEPWDAVIPEGYPNMAPPDRIRFVIDMVRAVVVDELHKKLFIRMEGTTPQQNQWLVQAIDTYPVETLDLIIPVPLFREYETCLLDQYASSLGRQRNFVEFDLLEEGTGGAELLYCVADPMFNAYKRYAGMNVVGGVGEVQGDSGSIFGTPNEINAFALFHIFRGKPIIAEQIWDGWLERRYSLNPSSREGDALKSIFRNSLTIRKKAFLAKAVPLILNPERQQGGFYSIPVMQTAMSYDSFPPSYRVPLDLLKRPNEQILVDTAQEGLEAMDMIQGDLAALQMITQDLNPTDLAQFNRCLTQQEMLCRLATHAKQSYLGFLYWQTTRSEQEALHLEAYLKNLESLSGQIASSSSLIRSQQILDFVGAARSQFPRVLMGAKERRWNQISSVVIQQTGPHSVEIRWRTDEPSTANVFLTKKLPLFDDMIAASPRPLAEHTAYLEGLLDGQDYYFKIQCKNLEGKVVNSGDFVFRLEETLSM